MENCFFVLIIQEVLFFNIWILFYVKYLIFIFLFTKKNTDINGLKNLISINMENIISLSRIIFNKLKKIESDSYENKLF